MTWKSKWLSLNACNLKSTGKARSPTYLQSSLKQTQANSGSLGIFSVIYSIQSTIEEKKTKTKQNQKIILVFSSGQILMASVHKYYMNATKTNKKQLWTEYMIHIPFRLGCYLNIFKHWILYAVVMQ